MLVPGGLFFRIILSRLPLSGMLVVAGWVGGLANCLTCAIPDIIPYTLVFPLPKLFLNELFFWEFCSIVVFGFLFSW